jgi:PAS domain S-box-containing protein
LISNLARRPLWLRFSVAVLAAGIGVGLRLALFGSLGTRATYVTLYPAVILAALFGGLAPGLVATVLSALAADYFWIEPAGQFWIRNPADWLGMGLFLFSCAMICLAVRAMHRAEERAAVAAERQAEAERLHESEEQTRRQLAEIQSIYELAPVGLCVLDSGLRFVRLSSSLAEMNGLPASAHLGRTLRELVPELAPQLEAACRQVMETGETIARLEVRGSTPAQPGVERTWLANFTPIKSGPQVVGISAVVAEITERKRAEMALRESEERLRLAQQAAGIGVFEWNVQTGVNTWTPELEAMYGLPPGGFARTQPAWENLVHPDDRAGALALVRQAFDTGAPTEGQWRTVRPDGSVHSIVGRFQGFRDDSGRPLRLTGVNIDMTERQRAEEELHRLTGELANRVEELRAILDAAPMAIWISHDPQSLRITGNAYADDVIMQAPRGGNVSASAATGQAVVSYKAFRKGVELRPDQLPAQVAAATGKAVSNEEWELVFAGGRAVHLLCGAVPLFDAGGRVRGSVTTGADVTDLRRAEMRLAAEHERLRLALTAGQMATWDWHVPSGEAIWNDEHYRMFGYQPGEVKPSYEAWAARVHPEDREAAEALLARAMERGGDYIAEFRVLQPDGAVRWMEARGRCDLDSAGRPLRCYGVMLDTTGRRRAEEKIGHYNAVLEARNQILRLTFASQSEEELGRACLTVVEDLTQSRFGFLAEINALGKLDNIAISDRGWESSGAREPAQRQVPTGLEIHGIYGRVILDGKGFYTNDPASHPDRIGTPEGHPPLDAFLGVPLKQDDKTIGLIGLGNRQGGYRPRDLEAVEAIAATIVQSFSRKRAEKAVREAEERLRQAQKTESLGLLAGGVAHDFNNLLVGVIGNASLAKEYLPPGNPAAELLDGVIRSGEQAAHLTRQMLAYSGKGHFVIEPLSLRELLPEMSHLMRASVSKKIALNLVPPEWDVPAIRADRGQIQQVFMNLVLNAAEAIGSGGGMISVRTGVRDLDETQARSHPATAELPAGSYVFLEVRDTGCGIDEATQVKIFDPFFSTKFIGRGLGLAAVAGIVRGHKGAITVSSVPGQGSCFTVLFPALPRAVSATPVPAPEARLSGAGTILVVDDEEVVRTMAAKVLERHGYRVLLASSGPEAIDLCKRHVGEIVAVVLDLSMPGMSGEEVLPELRKVRPSAKFLISSGYSEAEAMRMFQGQTVAGFIQKPYTSKRLAEHLKTAIG